MKATLKKLALVLGSSLALAVPVLAAAQQHPARHVPRVAEPVARQTALARVAGEVRHEEMEFENHRWIYSYEIKVAGRPGIEEVNVDADSGAIVDVSHERG